MNAHVVRTGSGMTTVEARVAIAAVVVFAVASVVAAVGHPVWAWLPVFIGLVAAPAVLIASLGVLTARWLKRPH